MTLLCFPASDGRNSSWPMNAMYDRSDAASIEGDEHMSLAQLNSAILRRALPWMASAALACTLPPTMTLAQDVPPAPAPQAAPVAAQPQAVHLQDYSKPRPAFPHFLQPYRQQQVAL